MKLKKILTKFKRLVSQNINNPYPLFFDEDLTLKDDLADVAKKFIEKTQDTTDDLEAFCHLKRDVKEFFYQRRLFYSPKVDLENHELAHRLKELVLFKKTISH